MRISDWSSDVCSSDLKGLFLVEGGGRQAPRNLGFLGDPVSAFLEDRRDGTLYAALNLGHFGVKLHRSEDFGATWTELPAPAFPVGMPAYKEGEKAPTVTLTWTLAAEVPDQSGALCADPLPGPLLRRDAHGDTTHLEREAVHK